MDRSSKNLSQQELTVAFHHVAVTASLQAQRWLTQTLRQKGVLHKLTGQGPGYNLDAEFGQF